jgi:hypothetical protein
VTGRVSDTPLAGYPRTTADDGSNVAVLAKIAGKSTKVRDKE